MEVREQPIFCNLFVADRYNHRIVKLDFGYYLYANNYEVILRDEDGTFLERENRTHFYRKGLHAGFGDAKGADGEKMDYPGVRVS